MNKFIKELQQKIERLEEKLEFVNHKEDKAYIEGKIKHDYLNIIRKAILIYPSKINEKIEKITIDEDCEVLGIVKPICFDIIEETDDDIFIVKRYLDVDGYDKLIKVNKHTNSIKVFEYKEIEKWNDLQKKENKIKKKRGEKNE